MSGLCIENVTLLARKRKLAAAPNEQLYQEWSLVAFYKANLSLLSFHPVVTKTSALGPIPVVTIHHILFLSMLSSCI